MLARAKGPKESMSDEEKAGHRQQEFDKRFKGLLQRYADNALSEDEFMEQGVALRSELKIEGQTSVVKPLLKRIEPGQDNRHWMRLVKRFIPDEYESLEGILDDYNEKSVLLIQDDTRQQLQRLARKSGIGGSAVIPNLLADENHRQNLGELRRKTEKEIEVVLGDRDLD